ncbi:MAG: S8 family serine peptidase [Methanobacteriota archaeon]
MFQERRTVTAFALALLTALPAFGFLPAPAAGDPALLCDLTIVHEGTVATGGEVPVAGANFWTDAIPASCMRSPFTLRGERVGDDIDVCFKNLTQQFGCFASLAGEAGVIPAGTTLADITFFTGLPGNITLAARRADAPAVLGNSTLVLRGGPTGVGALDVDVGPGNHLSAASPTKATSSVAHGTVARDGGPYYGEYDADWRWTPDGGFDLRRAPVNLSYYFTAGGTAIPSGASMQFALYADGVQVASLTHRSPPTSGGGVVLHTVPFGNVTAAGAELLLRIDAGFVDSGGVHGILYDSTAHPSVLTIGSNLIDPNPPSTVAGLVATTRSNRSIGLAWSPATDDVGIAGYRVYRGGGAAGESLAFLANTTVNGYIDRGLDASTTYLYAVRAFDVAGNEGELSAIALNTTLASGGGQSAFPMTVVAVVDSAYSPYHYDFLGSQHPWNLDGALGNDIDFFEHPSTYIAGFPASAPAIPITMPAGPDTNVDALRVADAASWATFSASAGSGSGVNLYWIPGTKVVGAVRYGTFQANNDNHGTRSAASAVGNIHGTCPECLVVLIAGLGNNGVTWAVGQPWIDIVTNSWESCFASCNVRNGIITGAAPAAWKTASQDGKFVVFAAGNGLENGFIAPQAGYFNSQKGTDWVVKVGAAVPSTKQSYTGSTKPVDISSIGSAYPSTGGTTATGTGTHSGTSNAAPVVTGMIAQVLQNAREALGDTTPGPAGAGVVATGTAVTCGSANAACPLGDGSLTRSELRDTVYYSVLPSTSCCAVTTALPGTPYNYASTGHGVVTGLIDGAGPYLAQLALMDGVARGDNTTLPRPGGEANWFVVDSKCRQRLTGTWTGGYWNGTDPAMDPVVDHLAMAWNGWCSNTPAWP